MDDRNRLNSWATVLVIALFIAMVFSQAGKKFALDEVDFPVLAKAISETGMPYHYRGETDPSSLGLWHPPLYAYSLAAFVKVFGFNENTVRAFGMFCTLLSAFLALEVYGKLFHPQTIERKRFSPLFLSLFLLHPYTIANTTVPDIDSTLLPISLLLFVYGLLIYSGAQYKDTRQIISIKLVLSLSALFALNLWAKMTTPLVLIPVVFLTFYIKGWSLKKCMVFACATGAVGGLIFLSTYAFYCFALSLPFDFVFRFLSFSFSKNSASGGGIGELLAGIYGHLTYTKLFVNWLGIVFVFALTLACGSLFFQRPKVEADRILFVLAGFGLFVTFFYLSLTGAFGGFFKYPYSTFSFLVIVVSHFFLKNIVFNKTDKEFLRISYHESTIKISRQQMLLGIFCLVTILMSYYQVAVAKDFVIHQNRPVTLSFVLILIGSAIVLSYFSAKKSGSLWLTCGLTILLAIMIGTQFGVSRSQAIATYPTKYHYGQSGYDKTVSYLKERLNPNETIWSMKDIGYYANGKYLENYSSIFRTKLEIENNLKKVINENNVRYFVVTTGIGQDRIDAYTELKAALDSCCVVEKQFGNFIIYKAK